MVVTLNCQVGLLQALVSKDVLEGGSLNNGLKDGMFNLSRVKLPTGLGSYSHVYYAMGPR
jgi:hypothetical protein